MPPVLPTFDATFASVSDVEGWMTEAQARRLWDRAGALEAGDRIVEIGSYRGRSAIMLATSAPADVEVVAIDPHAGNDRGPQQIRGTAGEGDEDNERFEANLARAGVRDRVRHVRRPSQEAGDEVDGDVDLLYIDGAHRYQPARDDIRAWGDRVAPGGTMLIHDSFSSVGVTLALVTSLFWSRRFRYVGRSTSMAEYRRVDLTPHETGASLLAQTAQLPWFVRNVIIKLLIVARLGGLARLVGHDEPTWPH